MAGLLDYITEAAKAQYAKGAPYRNALGGLLSGDMSALQELNKPSPVMPNEALDVAMTFAPMGIVGGDITKILKSLKQQNPSTYPKIPVNKIFKNDVGNLESLDRMKADEGFLNNATTNQFVNINDIIPTQKNVTTKNIKDINNVSALPELIKVNDKYYVNDGHHRISRDILTGDDKIQAKVYEGLLSNNKTPLTEFEVKHLTAQKNAALPVAEGGLGLPANNTAMDRAKALGFDDNWYHGRYSDYEQINPNKSFYATQDPSYASIYSYEPTASSMGGKSIKDFQDLKPNVMPVMIRKNDILDTRIPSNKNIFDKDFYMKYGNATPLTEKKLPDWVDTEDFRDMFEATNSKFKGVFSDEGKIPTWEGKLKDRGISAAIFDPSLVRSRFAAFDPFRRNEADILAGVGVGVPVASGLLDIENKKVPKKEKKKTK